MSDETGQPIVLDNGNTTAVHAMNEVTLHRGASQHLTIIDTYVDNQHFTESVVSLSLLSRSADGVVGGWTTAGYPDGIYGVLPLGRRTDSTSLCAVPPLDSNRASKSEFPYRPSPQRRVRQHASTSPLAHHSADEIDLTPITR